MQIVPLQAAPSQVVSVSLADQNCSINVYQKSTGVYVDLYVNSVLIIGGVIAENANRIVRDAYLGFLGDLLFLDIQGKSDPEYKGLGSQYLLLYLFADELSGV